MFMARDVLRQRAAGSSATVARADATEPEPEPRATLLGFDRNSLLAAVGAVTMTAAILTFQYAVYVYAMAPAALEEGDLPFIG